MMIQRRRSSLRSPLVAMRLFPSLLTYRSNLSPEHSQKFQAQDFCLCGKKERKKDFEFTRKPKIEEIVVRDQRSLLFHSIHESLALCDYKRNNRAASETQRKILLMVLSNRNKCEILLKRKETIKEITAPESSDSQN